MNDSKPYELELTPDRLDYVRRVARKEARKRCSNFVQVKDVIQEVHLNLLRKPPKHFAFASPAVDETPGWMSD